MPHDEVESSEFYKHIESQGLTEPRRMKQLLTWCGTRAMGEKPLFSAEDGNARLAGRLKKFWAWVHSTNSTYSERNTAPTPKRFFEKIRAVRLVQQGTANDFSRQYTQSRRADRHRTKQLHHPQYQSRIPRTSQT